MDSVAAYLASLPEDRRAALARVREVINAHLPAGFEERMQYGMISWCVPESVLPARETYNQQPLCLASLGAQKNHMALYLMCVCGDPQERAWFQAAYRKSGKKLDMGRSCVRFKTLDALPLEVIGEAIARVSLERYVAFYRQSRAARSGTRARSAKASDRGRRRNVAARKKRGT